MRARAEVKTLTEEVLEKVKPVRYVHPRELILKREFSRESLFGNVEFFFSGDRFSTPSRVSPISSSQEVLVYRERREKRERTITHSLTHSLSLGDTTRILRCV